MSYTQRQSKMKNLTFVILNEEDKWSRIIHNHSEKNGYGTVIQTLEYHGGRAWTLETIVKTDKPGRWERTRAQRITSTQVQAIAQSWRNEF